MSGEDQACENTDRELWRDRAGDFYTDALHVTKHGGIGIDCGGYVIVAPLRKWHEAGELIFCVDPALPSWKWKLAMRLLRRHEKWPGADDSWRGKLRSFFTSINLWWVSRRIRMASKLRRPA